MSKKQFKMCAMMAAGVAAGLGLTGCRTIHSRDFDRTPAAPDAGVATPVAVEAPAADSVRPTPHLFDADPVNARIATRSATEKPVPYYVSHGEVDARRAAQAANASSGKGGTYVVKKGDILGRIARSHGVTVAAIKSANGLTSDRIVEGQKLVIPGKGAKVPKTDPVQTPPRPDNRGTAPVVPPAPDPVVVPPPVPEPPAPVPAPAPAPDPVLTPPPAPAPAPDSLVLRGPVPAPAPAPAAGTYTVQEGDDVYALAIRWSVSPTEIKALNGLDGNTLTPGTVLRIPEAK